MYGGQAYQQWSSRWFPSASLVQPIDQCQQNHWWLLYPRVVIGRDIYDGLLRTAWQSPSHRNRLLLSVDLEQKAWQPVFGEHCLRPEGDLRIARYTWYHHLGQWSTIQCSDISPVCNELWVSACEELSVIPSIELRSRTACACHKWVTD